MTATLRSFVKNNARRHEQITSHFHAGAARRCVAAPIGAMPAAGSFRGGLREHAARRTRAAKETRRTGWRDHRGAALVCSRGPSRTLGPRGQSIAERLDAFGVGSDAAGFGASDYSPGGALQAEARRSRRRGERYARRNWARRTFPRDRARAEYGWMAGGSSDRAGHREKTRAPNGEVSRPHLTETPGDRDCRFHRRHGGARVFSHIFGSSGGGGK